MTNFKHHFQVFIILFIILTFFSCSSDIDFTPPAGFTGMAITHYSFGKMIIDGKNHKFDLSISPNGSIQGFTIVDHLIDAHNIKQFITDDVKTLIIGNGYSSMANVTSDTYKLIEKIKANGIDVHILPTSKAVKLFNSLSKKGLLSFFHLTC